MAVVGRWFAAVAVLALLSAGTACGGATRFGTAPVGGPSVAADQVAHGPSPADVRFLHEMIVHHQLSVDMAAMVDVRGSRYEVKTLAAELGRVQRDQIRIMRGWLREWESAASAEPSASASHLLRTPATASPASSVSGSTRPPVPTPGVATQAQLSALARAGGAALDRLFLDLLISHHQRSVDLATAYQRVGDPPAVRRLAQQIAATHQERLELSRSLLAAN
ncbi:MULTISPECIES: DUF305 domain-containing protein [unclassified Solwaraspora]|uniref:DUF305 domain-containing protein n=1 Tax=unclassified Solwaraspora TaxID=2627926 RepID=UPI00259B2FD3|nr:DUF305 domain-containing protein [Solwaraspora sp. WMMA2056]WJK38891.1 DUF305 domain-containing protein [Solwaraspora sp. WMMA2056]